LIVDGRAIDPNTYFIIIPNCFATGSRRPQQHAEPYNGPRFA